jgi:signal transduction histidine kinase
MSAPPHSDSERPAALRRPWSSLGFRLASYYAVLVAVMLLMALGIVHLQTVGVMHQGLERQVQSTAQQLMARYGEGGSEGIAAEIMRALRDGMHTDTEVYLLLAADGEVLAGNIDPILDAADWQAGASRRTVYREGRPVLARVQARNLPDGGLLVVGLDLREQQALEQLVGRASAAAALVSIALLVGGTFMFRMELERSIGALRRTAARIAAGHLQERVELTGDEDEFTLLKNDINHMLDRIQALMEGVRHVSDSIAHNLRTPLTRALLRLRAAQLEGTPPVERNEAIAAAVRDLEQLGVTFEKLLQIAEAESGTRRRDFGEVALEQIADDVVDLYAALAESRGATLTREPRDAARVEGDRNLLADALANLVDNALKYGGDAAVVRVGTSVRGDTVLLTVQDNGPGVQPEHAQRIGSRFHRLDPDTPGYGLGLASVRAIVTLHGGQIRFADAAPGLRVEMELPAAGA